MQVQSKNTGKTLSIDMLYSPKPSDIEFLERLSQNDQGQKKILMTFAALLNGVENFEPAEIDHLSWCITVVNNLPVWGVSNIKYFAQNLDINLSKEIFKAMNLGFSSSLYLKIRLYYNRRLKHLKNTYDIKKKNSDIVVMNHISGQTLAVLGHQDEQDQNDIIMNVNRVWRWINKGAKPTDDALKYLVRHNLSFEEVLLKKS